jgi:hypothetical protein
VHKFGILKWWFVLGGPEDNGFCAYGIHFCNVKKNRSDETSHAFSFKIKHTSFKFWQRYVSI